MEKYYPAILRYCRLHIDDYGYAEDMAQETFARFFRTLRQYRHYGKVALWLLLGLTGSGCYMRRYMAGRRWRGI